MEASHRAAVSLLEEQLLNAESRLAREGEQCRNLEQRWASSSTDPGHAKGITLAHAHMLVHILHSLVCLSWQLLREICKA